MDKKQTQRTTLYLDSELHKRLKLLAVERDTTLTDLVAEALQTYLERETTGRAPKRRERR